MCMCDKTYIFRRTDVQIEDLELDEGSLHALTPSLFKDSAKRILIISVPRKTTARACGFLRRTSFSTPRRPMGSWGWRQFCQLPGHLKRHLLVVFPWFSWLQAGSSKTGTSRLVMIGLVSC